MKIGISCNRFGSGGGLERYAFDVAGAINSQMAEPVVVYAREFDTFEAGGKPIEAQRIDVSRVPKKLRDHAFAYKLRTAPRGCDVLIGCNRVPGSQLAICGGTHRGHLASRGCAPGLLDRWQLRLEEQQYRRASTVVAHSSSMREELVSLYGLDPGRVVLLHPPVDVSRFTPVASSERSALRRKLGFDEDEIVFLLASSSHERKGLALLARHVAALAGSLARPLTLAVAGHPVGRALARVRELGYVRDIENLYRAADFTVLGSDYEPFGLVGIESILCGTPLAFADTVGCLEVVKPGAALRFSRLDDDSVAAALREAVRRVDEGRSRIQEPMAMLDYDPGVDRHAQALISLARAAMHS